MKLDKIEKELNNILSDISENLSSDYYLIIGKDSKLYIVSDLVYVNEEMIAYVYNFKEVIVNSKRLRYNIGYTLKESVFFYIMWDIVRKEIIKHG